MARHISYQITKSGQANLPGITAASKNAAEELLQKDADEHHCFFRPTGLHNHLSHQVLAAYDLGATPALLQKIYDSETKLQRPIALEPHDKEVVVDQSNWAENLGKTHHDYNAYVKFFSGQISEQGISATFEKYVLSEDANKDGRNMLFRVCGAALHPFIQIGYGAEFGLESLVAIGLAQACETNNIQGSVITIDSTRPKEPISLLELLRRIYDSEILTPPPYDPNTMINQRLKNVLANGGTEELRKLCALYHISDSITDEELDKKIDEIMWVATLLLSGSGKKGRKPRMDFFLMHFVTSSIFIRPILSYMQKPKDKAAFVRIYVWYMMMFTLARGRPRIDVGLAMSYPAVVRPPTASSDSPKPSEDSLGSLLDDDDFNPWPDLIQGALYHPESHVIKSIRSLAHFAARFGTTPPGGVSGAWRDANNQVETHPGIGQLDGTIFVRTAGVLLNTLGWCAHGQKQGKWDYSALGWEEAWNDGN